MIVAQDAGLGFDRTADVVMIQIFTQGGRSQEAKQSLFAAVADRLLGFPGLIAWGALSATVGAAASRWATAGATAEDEGGVMGDGS